MKLDSKIEKDTQAVALGLCDDCIGWCADCMVSCGSSCVGCQGCHGCSGSCTYSATQGEY